MRRFITASPYSPVETSQRRRRGSFIQEDETCRKDELPIASVMNKYFWADLSVKASLQRILIHKGKQRYAAANTAITAVTILFQAIDITLFSRPAI